MGTDHTGPYSERQALEPVCITLGDQQTLWALDIHGHLWFRTGIEPKKPQGDDDHWWQVGTQLHGVGLVPSALSHSRKDGVGCSTHAFCS